MQPAIGSTVIAGWTKVAGFLAASSPASHTQAVKPSDSISAGSLTMQAIVGLVVVLGLIGLGSRLLRGRSGLSRPAMKRNILGVIGRQVLGKGVSVALVQVGNKAILVGITSSTVSRLGEVEVVDLPDEEPSSSSKALGLVATLRSSLNVVGGMRGTQSNSSGSIDSASVVATGAVSVGSSSSTSSRSRPGEHQIQLPTWTSAIEHLREKTTRRA